METHTRRNALLNISGESLWGLKANLIAPSVVLAVLLHQYGASPELIGSISAIETSMLLLPQMLGGYLFHSRAHRKTQLVRWHYLAMLPFNIIMGVLTLFAPRIDPAIYRVVMLVCFACYTGAIGVVAASWFDYFVGTIYDSGIRGTVMGLSASSAAVTGTAGALFAGWLIQTLPFPDAYGYLYLISWAMGMLSITLFLFIKDPGSVTAIAEPRPTLGSLIASLRMSMAESNFRSYLFGRVLATVGFGIVPFIAIYYTSQRGGGLASETVVASYSAFTVANALGSLILGRLGDRLGHRLGIILGAGMQVVTLLIAIFISGPLGCILTYAGTGLASSCGFISHYNLVMEMCPPQNTNRVAHISTANLVIGIPASLAPLLAGWIAGTWDIPTLFMICSAVSLAAVLWLGLKFKEPRAI
jgi:MFS family permease